MAKAAAATEDEDVTLDGMSKSLDELVRIADATEVVESLRKGDPNPVESSGHADERGKVGGGRGDMSDSGGLDPMMIGKLAQAGLDAGTIADFAGFMSGKKKMRGKAFGRDDDEDEDDEEMEGRRRASPSPSPEASSSGAVGKYAEHLAAHMEGHMRKHGSLKGYKRPSAASFLAPNRPSPSGSAKKSMDHFREDPDIKNAIDVAPYLEAMTARTAERIDAVNSQLRKGFGNQTGVNRAMGAALYQMGSLLKSQAGVIDALAERLQLVERQPAQPKGATQRPRALQKGMPGEAGAGGSSLKKSEVLSTLSYMRLEKGLRTVGQNDLGQAIYLLEGGGEVDPAIVDAAQSFLERNPTEAETARAYH